MTTLKDLRKSERSVEKARASVVKHEAALAAAREALLAEAGRHRALTAQYGATASAEQGAP